VLDLVDRPLDEVPPSARLQGRGLTRRFGTTVVLDDVDIDVTPGQLVALVGGNGAGKSTLIACLARSLSPDAGDVMLDGVPLEGPAAAVQAHGVSVVWQDLALCDNLDAVANLFLGRERRSLLLAEGDMYAEANRLLTRLGIDIPDLHRPVSLLSGGQRQLVAIARAVLDQPRFLLLDEPTAALDLGYQLEITTLLRRLNAERGTTMIVSTHDLNLAAALCERVVLLKHGRVVAQGVTETTLTAENIRLLYEVDADVQFHPLAGHLTVVPLARAR